MYRPSFTRDHAGQARQPLLRQLPVFGRHAHEPCRLRVEVRRLREPQEEVADALAQRAQARLPPAAAQQVGLPVDQLRDVPRQAAVELADRPLEVQQDVQALFDAQERGLQGLVQLLIGRYRRRRRAVGSRRRGRE